MYLIDGYRLIPGRLCDYLCSCCGHKKQGNVPENYQGEEVVCERCARKLRIRAYERQVEREQAELRDKIRQWTKPAPPLPRPKRYRVVKQEGKI